MGHRPYQIEAGNAGLNYFYQHTGNPLIAMPTGTGKSHVIAYMIQQVFHHWPDQRVMVLTHVKELIAQNSRKMVEVWPNAPAGVYSAGLKRKELMPITFGGIASVIKDPVAFGHIDLLFIDEAHLLSPNGDTMYQKFILALKAKNPYLKVIGFSATPYRMGQGLLTDGGLFTDFAIDMTGLDAFNWFIDQAYLCRLVPKPTQTVIDTSNVSIKAGEFESTKLKTETQKVTYKALQELVAHSAGRRAWLIFATGIENAEYVVEILTAWGIPATCVHNKVAAGERDRRITDFLNGRYLAMVNNNVLTTGFDDPRIDLIGMLRATVSPGLWVQMLGRGTRMLFPQHNPHLFASYNTYDLDTLEGRQWAAYEGGKRNCLVLDFAGNVSRLGPINDPQIPHRPGEGTGEVPIKICKADKLLNGAPGCGFYNHTKARFCDNCGAEFHFRPTFGGNAFTGDIIKTVEPNLKWFNIANVVYQKHMGPSGKPTLRVTYWAGYKRFMEHITVEHTGFLRHKAKDWWNTRSAWPCPETVDECLALTHTLKQPTKVQVHLNKEPYPEIVHYEYE